MAKQRQIVLLAHNIRSTYNVGALLRTAEGLGITEVILSGYTPYPAHKGDSRLPHESRRLSRQINKTALGAEDFIAWEHSADIHEPLAQLRARGFHVWALEQTAGAIPLREFMPPEKLALIIGREVEGIETEILDETEGCVEIPMRGQKESFNVAQAAAMALFYCTNTPL